VNELEPVERVKHTLKLSYYAEKYAKQHLTLASAAKHAGVSVWVLQEYTRAYRISAQYDDADLDHDVATINRR